MCHMLQRLYSWLRRKKADYDKCPVFFFPFSVSWSFLNARDCLQNQLWKAGQDAAPRGLKKKVEKDTRFGYSKEQSIFVATKKKKRNERWPYSTCAQNYIILTQARRKRRCLQEEGLLSSQLRQKKKSHAYTHAHTQCNHQSLSSSSGTLWCFT